RTTPPELVHMSWGGLAGLAIQPEFRGLVPVDAVRPDVLAADGWAVLHDVDNGHGMAPSEPEILLEPVDDGSCLDWFYVEPSFVRERKNLPRGEPGLVFDGVQVSLK